MSEQWMCVKTDTKKVDMQKVPVPTPGPGQALVKMRLSTICGSDIHFVDEFPLPPGTPMGHEAVGELVDAGEGELVLTGHGSSARQTHITKDCPVDAVVMAVIDHLDVDGKVVFRKE